MKADRKIREELAHRLYLADHSGSGHWWSLSEKGRAPYFRLADEVFEFFTDHPEASHQEQE